MKNHVNILDSLFNDGAKALAGIFMIFLFFGSLGIFNSPLFIQDLIIALFCLFGLILLGILLFSKKVLFRENGLTFQGLIIRDHVFFKKQIDLQNVKAIKIYENKSPLLIPWWMGITASLLANENLYKFKLETTAGKEKYLISFKNKESKHKAIRFFESNTDLEIKNCGQ
ncbi:hypothetical protein [Allomuricauda sp. R78024]|uniref:hypothetical protein n=1 Tax=Allomuricauda sp. R78024 TaxID=3093867 RepID=UPI0037C6333A